MDPEAGNPGAGEGGNPAKPYQPPKPPRKKKASHLTQAQERLAQMRVKHPTATLNQLALRSGYANQSVVCTTLSKPHVQERIRELLEFDEETCPPGLLKKLKEGLNATRKTYISFNGEITEEREDPDFTNRHKYLETAAEWIGISEKRVKISGDEQAPLSITEAISIVLRAQCFLPTDTPPNNNPFQLPKS